MTWAPLAASAIAAERPIPLEPPDIQQIFP